MVCNVLIFTSLFLEIYRQNLQQSVKDGELSDAEVKSLERLQVMLCIPKQTVEKIHEEICGTLFEKVINIPFPYQFMDPCFNLL